MVDLILANIKSKVFRFHASYRKRKKARSLAVLIQVYFSVFHFFSREYIFQFDWS